MNKAIIRAKQLLDNIHAIPGYTDERGTIVIRITQGQGGVRRAEVWLEYSETVDLNYDCIGRTKRRKIVFPNFDTCANQE